ncbi:MAG: hypothetical protein AAF206_06445 [Bacteroidota bacterium]
MKYWPLFCLLLVFSLLACQSETTPEREQTPEKSLAETQSLAYEQEIIQRLNAYYEALSAENIDATSFFAPSVSQFFSASDVSAEVVQKSLENSFAVNDSREIRLNQDNIRIEKLENGYEAMVNGNVIMLNKGTQTFNNLIRFDDQFRITHYLPADRPVSADRKVGNAKQLAPPVVGEVLNAFRKGSYETAQACIHPEMGFYVVVKPGAMPIIHHSTNSNMLPEKVSWIKEGWQKLLAQPNGTEIPAFDCDKGFAEKGSYFAEIKTGYSGLSELLGYLQEFELTEMGKDDASALKKLESQISHKLVDTQADAAMYFGKIDEKWYLLAVDLSEYDCSA